MTAHRPGLWRNLLAMVYDIFLVAPLLMANSFLWVTVFGPTADATTPTVPAWLMQSTSAVVIILFFTLFWRKSGQTLGMQAWRIKLETVEGEAPSIMQCVTRCAVAVLSLGACGLGYWWSFFDSKGRRWHDIASKTRLVLVPKPQGKK